MKTKILHIKKKLTKTLSLIQEAEVNGDLDFITVAKTIFANDPSCGAISIVPNASAERMQALKYIPTYYRSSQVVLREKALPHHAKVLKIPNTALQNPIGIVLWGEHEMPLYPEDVVFDKDLNCIWPSKKMLERKASACSKNLTSSLAYAKQNLMRR